jgi:hypothetical protein
MKCFIEPLAALKMKYYVESVDAEISGVGKTHIIGEDIYVEDVIIFKQKCTGAHTDLDIEDEMKVMYERDQRGESSKNWNLWWHSHASMGVFWSGTDTKNIDDQASNGSFLLSIVTNKKGDFKTRFDTFPTDTSPFKIHTSVLVEDDIGTFILSNQDNPERENELLEIINEMELNKQKNEEELNAEYAKKIDKAEEQITAWQDVKNKAEEELAGKVKEYNDETDELNKETIDEYTSIASNELADDEVLRATVKAETLEKVTVPTSYGKAYKNGKSWKNYLKDFNKKDETPYYSSADGYKHPIGTGGYYDYEDDDEYDTYFRNGKYTPLKTQPSPEEEDDFFYKIQDIKSSQFLDPDNYPESKQVEIDFDTHKQSDCLLNIPLHNKDGKVIGFKVE